jgi:hypothetical protein
MWGWIEMKYADGFTLVLESGEWGNKYDRKPARKPTLEDPRRGDAEEVPRDARPRAAADVRGGGEDAKARRRQRGGGPPLRHPPHLANIAIRTGRKLKFDPVKEEFIGDELANRYVNPPMRAPWHL